MKKKREFIAGTMKDLLSGKMKKRNKESIPKRIPVPKRKPGRQWTRKELEPVIVLNPDPVKKKPRA